MFSFSYKKIFLNKLLFLSFFIVGVFFANDIKAVITTTVEVSPNPAVINSTVQINATAISGETDYSLKSITANIYVREPSEAHFSIEKSLEEYCNSDQSSTKNCNVNIKYTPTLLGEHKIVVSPNDYTGRTTGASDTLILNVIESGGSITPSEGEDAPLITNVSPSSLYSGENIIITGENLCNYKNYSGYGTTILLTQGEKSKSFKGNVEIGCGSVSATLPSSLPFTPNTQINVYIVTSDGGTSSPFSTLFISVPDNNQEEPSENINNNNTQNGGLLTDWPTSPGGTPLNNASTLPDLIKYLYEWGISLGGLVVFVSLIISGVQYLSSLGNPIAIKGAMERIQSSVLGLVLLLSSWLILNTINPDLTSFSSIKISDFADKIKACEKDSDCVSPDDQKYKCYNGFCAPDLEAALNPKPCSSVLVNGVELTASNDQRVKFIARGSSITITSTPSNCQAYIEFYHGGFFSGSCGGEKEMFLLDGNKNGVYTTEASDSDIKCIKLKTLEMI